MDIRIITMSTDHNLVKVLKNIFPTADVGLQRGVDLRNTGILSLYNAGLISHTVCAKTHPSRRKNLLDTMVHDLCSFWICLTLQTPPHQSHPDNP